MAAVAERQPSGNNLGNLLGGISSLASLFTGKTTKQTSGGGTTTVSNNISDEGIQSIVNQILGGSGGLAALASGERTAGLYNTTTRQQLSNDLISRTAGEAESRRSSQTTTTTPTTVTTSQAAAIDPMTGLLGLGGAMAAKKVFDFLGGDAAMDKAVQSGVNAIGNLFSNTSNVAPGIALGSVGSGAAGIASNAFGNIPGMGAAIDNVASVASNLFRGVDGVDMFRNSTPWFSMGKSMLEGDATGAAATGLGSVLGNAIVPGAGGIVGSMVSNIIPVGELLSSIPLVGDLLGSLKSVVCTELYSQGKMSPWLYELDTKFAAQHMSEDTLNGYRLWAVPLVKLMRKSPRVTNIVRWFAIERATEIASYSHPEFKPSFAGKMIRVIGEPMCWVLGKVFKPRTTASITTELYIKS